MPLEDHQKLTGPELYEQGLAYLVSMQDHHADEPQFAGCAAAAQACFTGANAIATALAHVAAGGNGQPAGDHREWVRWSQHSRDVAVHRAAQQAEQAEREAVRVRNAGIMPGYPEIEVPEPAPGPARRQYLINAVSQALSAQGASALQFEAEADRCPEYDAVVRAARNWVLVLPS
jgi:hypothetical protein